MALEIRTLGGALGAEVLGANLTEPLLPEEVKAIQEAFLEYHLLCFRIEPLEASDFIRVARYFGEPQLQLIRTQRHLETPEVSVLESTYQSSRDKPDDLTGVRLAGWHTDDSYFAVPAKATMLQSIAIPIEGGQTKFCNMRKAYEDFPDDQKSEIDGLRAVHGYDTVRAPGRPKKRTREEINETPDVEHPLVRTHDDTGQKSFYFNSNRTDKIVGWERPQSDALLDEVYAQITKPEYQYHHEWQVGDLLLWDNRCLVHAVNVDYPVGQKRLHQRILLKGERPV
tara:strand:- start:7927 stop:8775 length:849 start_codon:yes stop_codon:yes gene_type:complete